MNKKGFMALVVSAVVLLLISVWMQQSNQQAATEALASAQRDIWLPTLDDALTQIQRIEIESAGQAAIVLQKQDKGTWHVTNHDGYYASNQQLHQLFVRLTEARVLEQKTADAQYHDRFGVGESATNIRVFGVGDDGNAPLFHWLLGKSVRQGQATYVRSASESQVWLVDQAFDLLQDSKAWLSSVLANVPHDEIREVEIDRADAPTWTMSKMVPEQPLFDVHPVPDSQQLTSANAPDAIARVLLGLTLQEAKRLPKSEEGTPPALSHVSHFRLFDGQVLKVTALPEADQWVQCHWSLDSKQAEHYLQSLLMANKRVIGSTTDDEALPAEPVALTAEDMRDIAQSMVLLQSMVDEKNQRYGEWQFKVADHHYDSLFRDLKDWLQPAS